jgi:hypothetical protein
MAFGVIGAIVEAITNGPENGRHRAMSMVGINPKDGTVPEGFEERTFQFWPETISDTIEVGWNFKDIPGMSNALAQWSSNGGRTISFEVHFVRLMKPPDSRTPLESFLPGLNNTAPNDESRYNVDIVQEIKWLRAFCYPFYSLEDGYITAASPPVAILCVPGHGLGDATGNDCIYAVMTGCDVNYIFAFPDGTPRRASVNLTFRQVVQDPINQSIYTVGHSNGAPDISYSFVGEDTSAAFGVDFGGGRKKNDIKDSGGKL